MNAEPRSKTLGWDNATIEERDAFVARTMEARRREYSKRFGRS